MCLILLAWKARADLPLVVAANRDEWRERPAQPAHWWTDEPRLFAGRDLQAGGTWMGLTREGRFAAITNFRDPADRRSTAPSRGGLVTEYLLGGLAPREYLAQLGERAAHYNGFNLIAGDGESLWYFGSREGAAREIPPGIHGLSNHVLDEPWPKVIRGRRAMAEALRERDPAPRLFALLADPEGAHDDELPDTGVGLAWERRLSPPLIVGPDYGTRASTVVCIDAHGDAVFEERTLDGEGAVVESRREHLRTLS